MIIRKCERNINIVITIASYREFYIPFFIPINNGYNNGSTIASAYFTSALLCVCSKRKAQYGNQHQ